LTIAGLHCRSNGLIEDSLLSETELKQVSIIESRVFQGEWTWDKDYTRRQFDSSMWLVVKDKRRVIGFMIAKHVEDVLYLCNIAVDPAYQRRGIGWRMISEFVRFDCNSVVLTLTVKIDNPARKFYSVLGFYEACSILDYYDRTSNGVGLFMSCSKKELYDNLLGIESGSLSRTRRGFRRRMMFDEISINTCMPKRPI
jgi:ribosomal-protein-alanine N-acetyltransferase